MTFDCMTPEELAEWLEAASNSRLRSQSQVPCSDCPMWFHLEAKAAGLCSMRPIPVGGRPRLQDNPDRLWWRAKKAKAA